MRAALPFSALSASERCTMAFSGGETMDFWLTAMKPPSRRFREIHHPQGAISTFSPRQGVATGSQGRSAVEVKSPGEGDDRTEPHMVGCRANTCARCDSGFA